MRVELPMALRLLAHELRAPLGILQGYLRLLKDGRVDGDARTNMLTVMLKETGRLSVLARQASDLAAWQSGNAAVEGIEIPAAALMERVAAAAPLECDSAPDEASAWSVESVHGPALVEALAALAELPRRERPDRPLQLSAVIQTAHPAHMMLTMGPREPASTEAPVAGDAKTLSLESGGHGLALVLAGAVLHAHGADLKTTRDSVVVTLPLKGTA